MKLGLIRIFANKLDPPKESWEFEYEILSYKTWEEGLISDVEPETNCINYIDEYISNIELSEDLENIKELEDYQSGDILEIVGEYHEQTSQDQYTQEWDSVSWLENVKHRKLNEKQIELFINMELIDEPKDSKKTIDNKTNE